MQMQNLLGSLAAHALEDGAYQAILLTFTLLEVEDSKAMIASAVKLLTAGGILVIAVPDVWKDVLATYDEEPSYPHRLITETVDLQKTDKFTGAPYPFYAMRTETLITAVLESLCVLEKLEQGGPQNGIYLLTFRKLITEKAETPGGR